MPGLLSTMFSDEGGQSGQTQHNDVAADYDANVAYDIAVGVDMGGSYQELDGSTTTWENDLDVNAGVDVRATVDTVIHTGQSGTDDIA